MHLRSITIKGFKSFPDRTRLEFGPGVSVVVGPNGSGKSNITDAVLWALGEQSPVAVRGQSMQDVIFAGAPGRKASSAAEVELVLEDSGGTLGLGAPEISILRRLDRSGEGEYRLAGARCRLVDVIEMLSDTGLGKEMHSVISQGRVEALVTSKPRDRRLLIEEAAGLGKHRKRRRRAQLKLERTQDNLDRALDVEREARSRLRPLKRQAEAAELHARLERQTLEVRWQLVGDDVRAHAITLAAAEAAAAQARGRRAELEGELSRVGAQREAAEHALTRRSAEREELSRRSFLARAAGDRVRERSEALTDAARGVEGRLERHRGELELLQAEPEELTDPAAEGRIAELEAALAELEREHEQALARELATLQEDRERRAALAQERATGVEHRGVDRERADERLDVVAEELREAERAVEAARRDAARAGGELAAVNQFLATQRARETGVTLADQLDVRAGYELAVAAALDGRLRAALVASEAEGMAVLDRSGDEGGTALIADRQRRGPAVGSTSPVPGAERLTEHVSGPEPVAALARALLAGTWVVDSLEDVDGAFDGVAVTRGGRVLSATAGELRQAPAVGEERILAERNRREVLIAGSERAAQAEIASARRLEHATAAYQAAELERERSVAAYHAAVRDRDEAVEEERRVGATIERRRTAPRDGEAELRRLRLAAELDRERRSIEESERRKSERRLRMERCAAAIARDSELLPEVKAMATTLVLVTEAIGVQQAAFEQALAADREAGEQVAAQLRACAQQEAALQGQLHAAGEALTEAEVNLQRQRDRSAAAEQDLKHLAARLELDASPPEAPLPEDEREALAGRLERLARRREQLGPVNPLAQEEYAEAVEHVDELERQRTDLETALKELERLIADTDRQIKRTFEETFAAAARNFEQVATALFPGGSGRLRLVAEKDGPARVLGAADADGAEGDDADDEEVAEDLGEPEENLLGVEIEINPAGKEMKRLSLLSGGEKSMTALAFLFAVFLARPCPFYILDEVEAALDDLNIDRFLGLLRSYSERAQFIVVTHQKRTMEAADILYGVSMGGDGISKVISQRLPREEEAAA